MSFFYIIKQMLGFFIVSRFVTRQRQIEQTIDIKVWIIFKLSDQVVDFCNVIESIGV